MITETSKDFERPEGGYVTLVPSKALGLIGEKSFIKIERVNGDCSVDAITFTPDEARGILKQLKSLDFWEGL